MPKKTKIAEREEWLTTNQAMAELGLSEHIVINLNDQSGKGGPIRGHRRDIGPSGRPTLKYLAADVAAYKEERGQQKAARPAAVSAAALLPLVQQQLQQQQEPAKLSRDPAMTVAQASEYIGMSERALLLAVRRGELAYRREPAMPRQSRALAVTCRFTRASLDAWMAGEKRPVNELIQEISGARNERAAGSAA